MRPSPMQQIATFTCLNVYRSLLSSASNTFPTPHPSHHISAAWLPRRAKWSEFLTANLSLLRLKVVWWIRHTNHALALRLEFSSVNVVANTISSPLLSLPSVGMNAKTEISMHSWHTFVFERTQTPSPMPTSSQAAPLLSSAP